jgi:S-DNA-T family DNA segregation ATPase FtsK/SpoIIIE
MTTLNTPEHGGQGADVVSLDAAREHRTAPAGAGDNGGYNGPPPAAPPAAADGPDDSGATPADGPVLEGTVVRVDQPGGEAADWLADLMNRSRERRPVIHPALRSRREALATIRWVASHYFHVSAYHLVRVPKYTAKLAVRTPRGAARLAGGMVRWTFDLEGHPVRMAAVAKADPENYLKLSRQRDSRVRLRVWISGTVVVLSAAGAALVAAGPAVAQWAAAGLAVAALGWLGAPADRPLIDRAVVPNRVEKLTSDIVIRALGSLGLAAINQAIARNPRAAIEFKAPITRDGPGWRADLDLPYGVTVAEVMDRRDKLASGLRRQLGCVWPEADHAAHTGRLILWVGDQDMSKARQPAFPLAKHGAADLFKAVPFGTDQRGRLVTVTLMFASLIIGAIPRMGKTFLLRLLALIAALDARAELHLYDFKGTGDLGPLEPVAHRYRAGDDDEDIAYALADFRALREELRRRTKVIRDLPRDVCPANKVTPELAGRKSLGLHPVVIAADECQVMFEHPQHGGEFEEICTDLVKRGPALGLVLILATQRPDAKSLPTGISANAALRMCLKVMGQTENDMVLGTSAYKNGIRATMFAFSDKGICYFAGEGEAPRIVRSFYIDGPAAEKIALRARGLRERAGTLSGHALGEAFDAGTGPAFDLLADIAAVVHEPKCWSETVVTRLAELRPDTYGPWAGMEPEDRAAQLTNALRPYGVRTGQVWGTTADGRGANRRGITRDDITNAITVREQKRGPGGAA